MTNSNILPPIEKRTFLDAFQRVLTRKADEIGFIESETGAFHSFQEAYEIALKVAGGLAHNGISQGDQIALLLDNSLDALFAWFSITLSGSVKVPVNTAYKGRFLTHVLHDSDSSAIILEPRYLERLLSVADNLERLTTIFLVHHDNMNSESSSHLQKVRKKYDVILFNDLKQYDAIEPYPAEASDLMAIMYTSGTTGPSKGVLISHAHAYTYSSYEDYQIFRDDDRILVTLPFFHLAGVWFGVYKAIIHCLTSVIEPSFSVSRFWPIVNKYKITHTTLLGAMAELLWKVPAAPHDRQNTLRSAVMAPLATDVTGFCERFSLEAWATYGMSEIGCVLVGPSNTLVPGEAGLERASEYEFRLVRGDRSDCDVDEIGELWVKPKHREIVLIGYNKLPDKTAEIIQEGWVHTGDLFKKNSDGHYFFVDRLKDALRRRGENVSSFEVEAAINRYPSIYESAVVAVPSDISEDEIMAIVVTHNNKDIDFRELTNFLIRELPYFMVPRYYKQSPSLPKTPTQKIRKKELREKGVDETTWDREKDGIILRRKDR